MDKWSDLERVILSSLVIAAAAAGFSFHGWARVYGTAFLLAVIWSRDLMGFFRRRPDSQNKSDPGQSAGGSV